MLLPRVAPPVGLRNGELLLPLQLFTGAAQVGLCVVVN